MKKKLLMTLFSGALAASLCASPVCAADYGVQYHDASTDYQPGTPEYEAGEELRRQAMIDAIKHNFIVPTDDGSASGASTGTTDVVETSDSNSSTASSNSDAANSGSASVSYNVPAKESTASESTSESASEGYTIKASAISNDGLTKKITGEGYIYGGGKTTGNYYADEYVEPASESKSDSSVSNSGSDTKSSKEEKKDTEENKKPADEEKDAEENKKSDTASSEENRKEDSEEAASEETTEEEEKHGKDNPYEEMQKGNENTCLVSTDLNMPSNFTDRLHVLLHNEDTDNYYLIHMYSAEYSGHTYLPDGKYTVDEVDDDDNPGKYTFNVKNDETFSVESGEIHTIVLECAEYEEIASNSDAETTESDEETTESDPEDFIITDAEASDTESTEEATESDTESDEEIGAEETDVLPWRKVEHNGKGPEISYAGQSNGDYDVTITITHSGAIGEALFTSTVNGKEASEAAVQKNLRLVLNGEDTGLVVTFPEGEYKIGDTYSFATKKEWKVDEKATGTGKVYIAGVPDADGEYNVVLRVIAGGKLGEATYKLSTDGGKNWQEEKQTESDGVVSDKGTYITMAPGEYAEGDTYSAVVKGQSKKDYSNVILGIILAVFGGIAATVLIILSKKKAGSDKYNLQ